MLFMLWISKPGQVTKLLILEASEHDINSFDFRALMTGRNLYIGMTLNTISNHLITPDQWWSLNF